MRLSAEPSNSLLVAYSNSGEVTLYLVGDGCLINLRNLFAEQQQRYYDPDNDRGLAGSLVYLVDWARLYEKQSANEWCAAAQAHSYTFFGYLLLYELHVLLLEIEVGFAATSTASIA